MPRCWFTNVEIRLCDAFVLDPTEARKAIREMEMCVQRISALIEQLGARDEIEFMDPKSHEKRKIKQHRLVSEDAAALIGQIAPYYRLFLSWNEFLARKRPRPRSPETSVTQE